MFLFGALVSAGLATVLVRKLYKHYKQYKQYKHVRHHEVPKGVCLEVLKNALLTYALAIVRKRDFAQAHGVRYTDYNGSMLPPLHGGTVEEACLTYINGAAFRRQAAIELYLEKNLGTMEDVRRFMEELLEKSVFQL